MFLQCSKTNKSCNYPFEIGERVLAPTALVYKFNFKNSKETAVYNLFLVSNGS